MVWVSDGFARALANDGFVVERVETSASAGDLPTVGGTLKEAFVRSFLGGAGSVIIDVTIEKDGRQVLATSCEGGKAIMVWVDPATEFRNTLTAALDEAIATCLPKLTPTLQAAVQK